MKVNQSVLMDPEGAPSGPEKKKPGRKKKRAALCLTGIALLGAVSLGAVGIAQGGITIPGIGAYQTDLEDSENIFTVGEVQIEQSEPNFPTEDDPDVGRVPGVPDECELITPYMEIPKDPRITNVGINDAIVFFRVTAPVETLTLIGDDGSREKDVEADLFWFKQADDSADSHQNNFNPNFVELTTLDQKLVSCPGVNDEGKGKTYIFGWHVVLKPGESTETLFDKVQNKKYGSRTIGAEEVERIKIEAFAIQAEYIKQNGVDMDTTGTLDEAELTHIYNVFINQNADTAGAGG